MNPPSPQVSVDAVRGIVRVQLGPDTAASARLRRQFIGRVFSCEHVTRVDLRRDPRQVELRIAGPATACGEIVREIGLALGGERCLAVPDDALVGLPVSVRRVGSRVTTWQVVAVAAKCLRFSHRRLRCDRMLARRCQRLALTQPGVRSARLSGWASDLVVRFDPGQFLGDHLLAELQHEVDGPPRGRITSPWEMTASSATLGVAAAADLAVSALSPVSAVLLVGTNIRTLTAAVADLMRWRISMPVVAAAIVFGTLATGQFLASGIMAWSFDFWRRRHRRDMDAERRLLMEDALPWPRSSPAAAAGMPPADRGIDAGHEVRLELGDVVPADGRVIAGGGVIDDRSVSGIAGARGVRAGEFLPAGAVVLGGRFSLVAETPLAQTRLAMIGRMLEEATHWRPGRHAPTKRAEEFGEQLAAPTLATAGLGLLAGDIATAVAVMRPDYANAEAIAGSFDDLDAVSRGLAAGCVIRSPAGLDTLAMADAMVLFPYPDVDRGRLEVVRVVRSLAGPLPASGDEAAAQTEAIRWAASLASHVADERREALAHLACDQGIPLLVIAPESFGDADGVRILGRVGGREITIRDAVPERDDHRPLVLEIDGCPVATFEFGRSHELHAAAVIKQLREEFGLRTFLVVKDGDTAGGDLAATIGCDGVVAVGRRNVKACIEQFVEAGCRVACVGADSDLMQVGAGPQVTIEVGGGGGPAIADIVMLSADLARIPDLIMAGQERIRRRTVSRRLTILPNALCVAGAFLLGFTSLVAAVVCNVSTLGMYRLATRGLAHDRQPGRLQDRIRALRRIP